MVWQLRYDTFHDGTFYIVIYETKPGWDFFFCFFIELCILRIETIKFEMILV